MSVADLARRGAPLRIRALPTKTELRLGRLMMGDGRMDSGSVRAFTLYLEKDMRCCKLKKFQNFEIYSKIPNAKKP